MKILMKHQKQALKWACQRARVALFMEMRLGKTLTIMRWAEDAKLKRILVLGPLDVLPDWIEELQDDLWADEDICVLEGSVDQRYEQAKSSSTIWTLANYHTILYRRDILELGWDGIILDESTTIKNPKADITKILVNRVDKIGYRAILSGLPAPESEQDYCEQFRFLHGNFMHEHNFWWWRKRHYYQAGFEWRPRSGSLEKIKEYVSINAFVMTAEEAGIGDKKIYEKRYVHLNREQLMIYEDIEKNFEYQAQDDKYAMTKWITVRLSWLHRVCGGFSPEKTFLSAAKFEIIDSLMRGDLKGKSVVIWFKHTAEMEEAERRLQRYGCAFYNAKRKEGEDEFKAGKRKLMLAQAKCARFGIDWSVADTAIYYSNWWSCETRQQSEKRIAHPKKKRPLLYIDILARDSVDVDVLTALKGKSKSSKQFLKAVMKSWRRRHALRDR